MAILTPPPAAPQRGDRTTFASRVDAFITWLINFVSELVSLVANLNSIAAGGAYAIPYTIVSSTPYIGGGGHMCFNDSVALYFDTTDVRGAAVGALLNSLNTSSSAAKGTLKIVAQGDPTRWITYSVSAYTPAQNGLYGVATVSFLNSSNGGGAFTLFNVGNMPNLLGDSVLVLFQRTGDKGDKGDTGTSVAPTLYVRDEKTAGLNGGSLTSGAARTLNTIKINSIPGASLSSNRVTVPAGTYNILGRAPASYAVQAHRVVLWSVTDNTIMENGSNAYSQNANDAVGISSSLSIVEMRNTVLTTAKTFELRHYFSGYGASTASGGNGSSGTYGPEIYAELIFEKVG